MKTREEKQKQEEIPTAVAVLDQWMKLGTILKYSEKPIIFNNSQQSAVKLLEVNIFSTETKDQAVLHKIHTDTRPLNTNYGSK